MRKTQMLLFSVAVFLSLSRIAIAGCGDELAAKYKIHVDLVKAIIQQESKFNNGAIGHNRGSYDMCMMQVNSWWVPKLEKQFGFTARDLRSDPCKCVEAGLWILSQSIDRYGLTWTAIGDYNAKTPAKQTQYAWQIYRQLTRLRKDSPWVGQLAEDIPYRPVLVKEGEGFHPVQ
jgi:soluble lytic murein transglycosylase-like protein